MNLEKLFTTRNLSELKSTLKEKITKEVAHNLKNGALMNNEEEIINAIYRKLKLELPVINENSCYQIAPEQVNLSFVNNYWNKRKGRGIMRNGSNFTFVLPFKGKSEGFTLSTTTIYQKPSAQLARGRVLYSYTLAAEDDYESIVEQFKADLASTKVCLDALSTEVKNFNSELKSAIKTELQHALEHTTMSKKSKVLA